MYVDQIISRGKLCFLCSFLFILFSCHKNDLGPSGELSLNKTAIRVDTAVGTVDSFIVHSTVPWTASLSAGANWFQIDKSSGGSGNTTVKLTVLSNDPTVLTQTATITIAATGPGNISPVTLMVTKKSLNLTLGFNKEFGGTNEESSLRATIKLPTEELFSPDQLTVMMATYTATMAMAIYGSRS